jgi:hypothetical protein
MRSVHIVFGNTGTYEDHSEWPVAAFTTKARAETYVKRANDWLEAHDIGRKRYVKTWLDSQPKNPYDPDMRVESNGVLYHTYQIFLNPPLPTKAVGA